VTGKFDYLLSVILAQVDLTGNPFSCLLQPALHCTALLADCGPFLPCSISHLKRRHVSNT
jgi:hypothetical protein